jgi:AcrR family transcriptional regulator
MRRAIVRGAFVLTADPLMPAFRKVIPSEILAEAKRLYEQTLTPMADIAALMGVCRSTLYNRVRELKWKRRSTAHCGVDVAYAVRGAVVSAVTASPTLPLSEERRFALAERIQGVVERQMEAVERVLGVLKSDDQAEAERTTRTLAHVTRVMREIAALTRPDAAPDDDADDDPIPRDIDELRFELARRIHAIIDAQAGQEDRGPERILPPGEPSGK